MNQAQHPSNRGELRPDMEDVQIAHLAGVFDAVGSITVHVTKNDKYSIGYQFQPVVRLHRPGDEEAMIGKLMAYAEEQGVRHHVSEKSADDGVNFEFVVNKPDSIERFLTPLMPYLVSKYEQSVLMLDEIIPGVQNGEHRTKEGLIELMDAADEIRSMTHHGPEPKYTKDYFEEEWDIEASA